MFYDLGNVGVFYRFTGPAVPGRHHRSTSVGGALIPGVWLCMTRKLGAEREVGSPIGSEEGSAQVIRLSPGRDPDIIPSCSFLGDASLSELHPMTTRVVA